MSSSQASRSSSRGMSLIELMIAISIGTLIVAAMALLFASNSRSRSETERTGHNIENGRYAIEVLRGELHHAGYFAEFDPRALTLPVTKPDPCLTDLASLRTAMPLHIQGYTTMAAGTLSCLTDVKVGTDAFVTRRASGCTVANPAATGCTALGPARLLSRPRSATMRRSSGSGELLQARHGSREPHASQAQLPGDGKRWRPGKYAALRASHLLCGQQRQGG